jgi:hypothetical protein
MNKFDKKLEEISEGLISTQNEAIVESHFDNNAILESHKS